jgi:hypothetical protein
MHKALRRRVPSGFFFFFVCELINAGARTSAPVSINVIQIIKMVVTDQPEEI